jgi:phospholipase/carboxylesterase
MLAAHRHVFLPGADPAAAPLLLLHGTGGDENDLIPLARRIAPGSAVLSPRGNVLEQGAARFFRRLAEGVFDLDDVRNRTHALADFVAAAARQYGFATDRLMAVGFSNGANIGATLLQLRPEILAGGVLLRPMVVLDQPAGTGSLRGRRALLASGELDPLVPGGQSERLARLLRAGGAEVTLHTSPGAGHGLAADDLAAAQAFLSTR